MRAQRLGLMASAVFVAGAAWADSTPKSIEVKVETDGRYNVETFRMGPSELVGYLGDRKDEIGIQAVVWVGKGASAEHEGDLAKLAARVGLKAFYKEQGKLRELGAKPGDAP